MKKIALILLSITTLQAALPPLAQSNREIKQIVSDPRLYEKLGGAEVISEIIKIDGGYEVRTLHKVVFVKVNYLPIQQPGPARFELEFYDSV